MCIWVLNIDEWAIKSSLMSKWSPQNVQDGLFVLRRHESKPWGMDTCYTHIKGPEMSLVLSKERQISIVTCFCLYTAAFSIAYRPCLSVQNSVDISVSFICRNAFKPIRMSAILRGSKALDWGQWTGALCWITGTFSTLLLQNEILQPSLQGYCIQKIDIAW